MAKEKEKPLYVQLSERDDFSDLLRLIPSWVWGAVLWYAFSKIVLDSLSPKKPGTEINLAIIGSGLLPDWIVGEVGDLPPGVKLAALIDVSLAALDIKKDLTGQGLGPPSPAIIELMLSPVYRLSKFLEDVIGADKK
jgi:hypothetical protein